MAAADFVAQVNGTATTAPTLTVDLGPDVLGIEPYTTRTITATVTNGSGATLTIEQFLGPSVLLSGTGPSWTYTAPSSVVGGQQLMFRVTATPAVGSAASGEVVHFVAPNTFGYCNALGQLVSAFATTTGT